MLFKSELVLQKNKTCIKVGEQESKEKYVVR